MDDYFINISVLLSPLMFNISNLHTNLMICERYTITCQLKKKKNKKIAHRLTLCVGILQTYDKKNLKQIFVFKFSFLKKIFVIYARTSFLHFIFNWFMYKHCTVFNQQPNRFAIKTKLKHFIAVHSFYIVEFKVSNRAV